MQKILYVNVQTKISKIYTKQNLDLYNKLLQESISEKGAKAIHKFWIKNAPKLDMNYSTTFSNLS